MHSETAVNSPAEVNPSVFRKASCPEHGDFEQRVFNVLGREIKSGCPECLRIRAAEKAEHAEIQESLARRIDVERKLGSAMIPKRFTAKTFDSYCADTPSQSKALAVCIDYANNFQAHFDAGRCMLLLGKPGTGKTHLAVAIANHLIANTEATAVYRTIGSVLQAIRETFGQRGDQSEAGIIKSLTGPSLLVLDEIGASKETPSDFELTTLFAIINGRYENLQPTIIVSNLGAKELPGAIGERCADRLREGGVIVLPFNWESQRGKEGF